jgi:HPt (histidine-containing phosphotransfer) domain-containing protein
VSYQLDEDSGLPPHLLRLFLRTTPPQVEQLAEACLSRDVDRARATAHKLKGSLYAAGASRLASDVETLRALLGAADFVESERQLRAVRDDFEGLRRELERRLREAGA